MEEENNNNPNKVVEEGKKIAKQALKDGAKKAGQKVIAWAAPVIGWIALILIAVGCLNLIVYEIRSFFRGKSTSISPDELSSTASIQMQELVTFNENGGYKLSEDYANNLIEELRSKSIDPEKLRFITPNGTNMLEKYMEIELGMMFPKTGKSGDFDGLVKIERIKSNGTKINLKYQKYDDFKASPSENNFSINPETFKIVLTCAGQIEEHDYQQLIQPYSVPFDFLLVLHSFSENINFMNAVVNKILESDEPIVLSYIESSVTEVTKKTFSGQEDIYEKLITIFESGNRVEGQQTLLQTNEVNNENIEYYKNKYNISSIDLSWLEKTNTIITGHLTLRKADTWLKTVEKEVKVRTIPESQVGETETRSISSSYSILVETKEAGNRTIEIYNIYKLLVTEEIITIGSGQSITLVDLENKLKVDEFVDLIKRYPKVRNNFETAPSNIFALLEEQEHTQTHAKIMRYVLYKLTGINYGVTEEDLEYILNESFLQMSGLTGSAIDEKIWFTMLSLGYSKEATAGVLGNVHWESGGIVPNKLEYGKISGYTSETYTDAVDNGTYTNFVHDGAGYGIAQWTYFSRKEGLYLFAQNLGVSISNDDLQIQYLLGEMGHSEYASGYASNQLYARNGYTIDSWKNAKTPGEAALAFCWIFENPRNSS